MWSCMEVMVEVGLIPTLVELATQRMQWMQSMLSHPEEHAVAVAAIWGQLQMESEPTVDAEGELTEIANSMARRMQADYQVVLAYGGDALAEFDEIWRAAGGRWASLFACSDVRDSFVALDLRVVRAGWRHHTRAAPAAAAEERGASPSPELLVCGLLRDDEQECALSFSSKSARSSHQRTPGFGGQHGEVSVLYSGTLSKVCGWCGSTFANQKVAAQHTKRAYKHGRCLADRSFYRWELQDVARSDCPFLRL